MKICVQNPYFFFHIIIIIFVKKCMENVNVIILIIEIQISQKLITTLWRKHDNFVRRHLLWLSRLIYILSLQKNLYNSRKHEYFDEKFIKKQGVLSLKCIKKHFFLHGNVKKSLFIVKIIYFKKNCVLFPLKSPVYLIRNKYLYFHLHYYVNLIF